MTFSVSVKNDIYSPTITIYTPEIGDIFIDFPPIYSIAVEEPNLNIMWFTLDNGTTKVTIADLTGVIDQSAWDVIPDGHLTLTIYAMDKPGNIGQNSVIITKRSTPEQIPPAIPGYDIIALLGVFCIVTIIILKKRTN